MAAVCFREENMFLFPSDSLTADQWFKRKSWIALPCSANFATGSEWYPI